MTAPLATMRVTSGDHAARASAVRDKIGVPIALLRRHTREVARIRVARMVVGLPQPSSAIADRAIGGPHNLPSHVCEHADLALMRAPFGDAQQCNLRRN